MFNKGGSPIEYPLHEAMFQGFPSDFDYQWIDLRKLTPEKQSQLLIISIKV